MATPPRPRRELDRAIDRAVAALAGSIINPAETAAVRAFVDALRIYTRRPFGEAFPRQDIVAVGRMILMTFGDRLSTKLCPRLPDELADAVDHEVIDAVCVAINTLESQIPKDGGEA